MDTTDTDRTVLAALLGERAAEDALAQYGDLPTLARAARTGQVKLPRGKGKVLAAALAVASRSTAPEVKSIRNARDVRDLLAPRLAGLLHEEFWAVLLDTKHNIVRCERIVSGGLTSCSVLPREAFAPAVRLGCSVIIFVHNHPSGNVSASNDDLALFARLRQAGAVLGIAVLDNVIVGGLDFWSAVDSGV